MPMVARTPPLTIQARFPPVFDDEPAQKDPLPSTSYSSSPELKLADSQSPIPEEEEDETSSETAEPLTPTDHLHQGFADKMDMTTNGVQAQGAINPRPPLIVNTKTPMILNTSATPPLSSSANDTTPTRTSLSSARSPKPIPRRQGSNSADTSRRTFSGFFRRSNSQSGPGSFVEIRPDILGNGSDPTLLSPESRRISTSASTTRSNSPPTPGSPIETTSRHTPQQVQVQEPSPDDLFQKKKQRSATGLSIRDKIKKISGHTAAVPKTNEPERHRAASVDLESSEVREPAHQNPDLRNLERSVFGISAETGIGLKSRRLSLSLPDDFMVETSELYSLYKDQSRIIGRRGKNVGTGATSNVKLMIRKGTDEVYAVKEFRGKGTKEKTEEYEKKIKSEYSIAKSAHHPNIVETISLCTHNGRWNHVMEYCEAGDLFSLVQQKYLSKAGHEKDRLCLFKQLIQGLYYLHGHGIAHRDIKLENLLITKDSKLKISDFGVSEIFCGIHPGLRSAGGQCGKGMEEIRLCTPGISGSKPYLSPEVLAETDKYDPRALDVWGAGTVMLHIICSGALWDEAKVGKYPVYDDLVRGWEKWNAKHTDDAGHDIAATDDGDYPHVSFFDTQINPPSLRKLLLKMLNPNPAKRITIPEITAKGWVKHIECCQVDSYDEATTIIDASKAQSCLSKNHTKVMMHNHLPRQKSIGQSFVRMPGSADT